ncbi:MAG: ABC-2 transporter permease [Lachnospiraceae bacterium]|nr:ABC-2 transporter permease [Lachnospiraceae bacterium]
MSGLLYKDFMAIKGRIYLIFLSVGMLLLFLMRIALHIDGIDLIMFSLYFCLTIILFLFLVNKIEVAIISADEGRKRKNYCLGLPISKQTYVASKYIFLLIGFFVALSVLMLLGSLCGIGCKDKAIEENLSQLMQLVPVFACTMLFIPSIELPFFICFGSKKGTYIKNGILIAGFFFIIVYLMFGDLDVFDKISVMNLLSYLEKYLGNFLSLQVLLPYGSLGLYYVSYRISCLLFLRREWEND